MDGMAAKQSSKEVEWRQRLARFAANGQQIKPFCQAESVSEATFYRWRKQLAETVGAAPAAGTGLKLLLEGIEPKRVRRRYKNTVPPKQNVSTNAGA